MRIYPKKEVFMRFYSKAETFPVYLSIDELQEMQESGKFKHFTKYYLNYLKEYQHQYKYLLSRRWIAYITATKVPYMPDEDVIKEGNAAMQVLFDKFGMEISNFSPEELVEMLKPMVKLSTVKAIKTKGAEELLILKDRETGYEHDGISIELQTEKNGTQLGE